jgi:hypothetical protein
VAAREESRTTGAPARRFKDFTWSTRKSWSCRRRVIGKAEWTKGEANPRFIVTSLAAGDGAEPASPKSPMKIAAMPRRTRRHTHAAQHQPRDSPCASAASKANAPPQNRPPNLVTPRAKLAIPKGSVRYAG